MVITKDVCACPVCVFETRGAPGVVFETTAVEAPVVEETRIWTRTGTGMAHTEVLKSASTMRLRVSWYVEALEAQIADAMQRMVREKMDAALKLLCEDRTSGVVHERRLLGAARRFETGKPVVDGAGHLTRPLLPPISGTPDGNSSRMGGSNMTKTTGSTIGGLFETVEEDAAVVVEVAWNATLWSGQVMTAMAREWGLKHGANRTGTGMNRTVKKEV